MFSIFFQLINKIVLQLFQDERNTTTLDEIFTVNFSLSMYSLQCLYWTGKKWTAEDIIVSMYKTY